MKKESMTPRKIKGIETKNKLYECACKLFGSYRFDDVSVDEIAEAAGVSKGTFYVHFESKDALIASVVSDYVNTLDTDYQSHLNSLPEDMPASDVILSLVGKITDILVDVVGYSKMRAVYKVQLTKTIDIEVVKSYSRQLYSMFSDMLGRGIQHNEFRTALPLDILSRHFVMAIRGLCYEWCIRYPDFDLKRQSLEHFAILLEGIKA